MSQEKKPIYMSKMLMILLCIWAASASIFAIASTATNFSVKTPLFTDLFASPSDISIEAAAFSYNPYVNRFTNTTVDVKNNDGSTTHTGTILVILYNSENAEIARGQGSTGTISPGVRIAITPINLTWVGSYTVTDFIRGKITLTQIT